ncbi:MAG TPA: GNAT family N-acetyltransferase [Candidatus Acidoferrum sp.]|nr:GNAT family N-acetyltransferase [Candidatus Acidoferrum sp.]
MESTWPPNRLPGPVNIEHLGPGDDARVMGAAHLFDEPPRPEAVARFLADPTHHLVIAYVAGDPVGFVSGVEVTHPDKGTEMFLYELGVDSRHRHHGIGTALVEDLAELARSRGCYGMWVLVDDENEAAAATYRKAHGDVESQPLMFSWRFQPEA